jgi:hypothetical protein
MAWSAVSELFGERQGRDTRGFKELVSDWLKETIKSERVRCEKAEKGEVWVRVGSALLKQEVLIREEELRHWLLKHDLKLKKLLVSL